MSQLEQLWVERHRPTGLEDYLFQDATQKRAILRMIADRTIPHLILSGAQGTGKTTLARVLISELDLDSTDVLTINASDENSVDVIRDKIKGFISTFALGDFKVVLLEEADYVSPNGQAALRMMMEQYVDVARFILTANYPQKIIPAIHSRCQHFKFRAFDKDDIAERVSIILASERVKFDLTLVDKYVAIGYPDIRKIINMLQQHTHNGELHPPQLETEVGDYKFKMLELLEQGDWVAMRKLLCDNVTTEEWEDVYRFLYQNLHKSKTFYDQAKWEAGIVIIADHLYKHSICSDAEINAAAMFIGLSQLQ